MYIRFYKTDICTQCGIVNHLGLEYLPALQINIQSEHLSHVCSHQLAGVLVGGHRLRLGQVGIVMTRGLTT